MVVTSKDGNVLTEAKCIEKIDDADGVIIFEEAYASTSALIQQYADKTGQDVNKIDGRYIIQKFKEKKPS